MIGNPPHFFKKNALSCETVTFGHDSLHSVVESTDRQRDGGGSGWGVVRSVYPSYMLSGSGFGSGTYI